MVTRMELTEDVVSPNHQSILNQFYAILDYPFLKFQILFDDKPVDKANIKVLKNQCILKTPYAGIFLNWEILWNPSKPHVCPDFVSPDDESFIDFTSIKSIRSWSLENTHAILDIMLELLDHYREHQLAKAKLWKFNQAMEFEISSLSEIQNVEFIRIQTKEKTEVQCLIPLDIAPIIKQFCKPVPAGIKAIYEKMNRNPYADVRLLLSFRPHENPNIQIVLPGNSVINYESVISALPKWEKDTVAVSYLPSAKTALVETLSTISSRKRLCEQLIKIFGPCLEYDASLYLGIWFAFDHSQSSVIVKFVISESFPQEQPQIAFTLLSHQNPKTGKPIVRGFKDYPYSPRWSAEEYGQRMKVYLRENIPTFLEAVATGNSI